MLGNSDKRKNSQKEKLWTSARSLLLIGFIALVYILLTTRIWLNYRETKQLTRENRILKQHIIKASINLNESYDQGQSNQSMYVKPLYHTITSSNLTQYKTLEETGLQIVNQNSEADEGLIIGGLENIDVGLLSGWACRKGYLNESLQIHLFVDNRLVAIVNRTDQSPNQYISDICLTTFKGKFLSSKAQLKDRDQNIGFQYMLPDLQESEHQLRAFAVVDGSKQGIELIGSPLSYLETRQVQTLKFVNDRKDRLLIKRNQQIVDLNDQLRTKPWHSTEVQKIKLNQTLEGKSNESDYLAVIGVFVKSKQDRDLLRATWFPTEVKYKTNLEKKHGMILRFLAPKGDITEDEFNEYEDTIRLNVDRDVEASKIAKAYFSQIYHYYKAQFYFKMDQNTILDIPALIQHLQQVQNSGKLYLGCFKSGQVYTDSNHKWYEPDHKRFGDALPNNKLQYIRHTMGNFYGASKGVIEYLTISSPVLHEFIFEDVQFGSWMLALDIEYSEGDFCCAPNECGSKKSCIVIKQDTSSENFKLYYKNCILDIKQTKQRIDDITKGQA